MPMTHAEAARRLRIHHTDVGFTDAPDWLLEALTVAINVLQAQPDDVPAALAHYAQTRWQRNARVQARAIRNGQIFHLQGPARLGRDTALRLLGARLLDVPWLYGYRA